MSLRTKLITVPAAITAAIVLAIWLQAKPSNDDNYVLSVTWKPSALPMGQKVSIVVSVDGFPLPVVTRRLSPWGETMTAAPGAVVTLTAVSNYSGTQMVDCIIMRNGRSVGEAGQDKRLDAGIVSCTG